MQSPSLRAKVTRLLAAAGCKPGYITGLDSATLALQTLARYLHGKDLSPVAWFPEVAAVGGQAINLLPPPLLQQITTWAGWANAASVGVLEHVEAETISRWVVNQYPRRRYPGALIGSTNGAAVHLGAALGIPWLPQTLLICLRRLVHPDRPQEDLEWARVPAQMLLSRNPDLWVYQMHDPNQDRPKISHVGYFRLKRTRLGTEFKQFLKENLAPGATLFLLECTYQWQSTPVGDRHVFQFGGTGDLPPTGYFSQDQQIREFLKQHQSESPGWCPPAPQGEWPEAEWGFEPTLRQDVEEFAQQHGYRVRRIIFQHPQDLSPLVADLYRWWYQQRQMAGDRLLVESFVYLQPWWVLRLGMVPFWAVFNDQTSLNQLRQYLNTTRPYTEIYANLFSNGIRSIGLAAIEQWRSILERATQRGAFVGVNEQKYPHDLAANVRSYTELKQFPQRYPLPEPLGLAQLDAFLAETRDRYGVEWLTEPLMYPANP